LKKQVIIVLIFILIVGCTSVPRYISLSSSSRSSSSRSSSNYKRKLPSSKAKNPKLIPVIKNPKLSYKQSWHGMASYYGKKFHGKKTANGEIYNMHAFTAAHKTLPLGTMVKVTNIANRKSVIVKINDRGPYIQGRIIDLSYAAAQKLDYVGNGTAEVKIKVLKFGDNGYKK
jgi:rare lipoprotein A